MPYLGLMSVFAAPCLQRLELFLRRAGPEGLGRQGLVIENADMLLEASRAGQSESSVVVSPKSGQDQGLAKTGAAMTSLIQSLLGLPGLQVRGMASCKVALAGMSDHIWDCCEASAHWLCPSGCSWL